jgi:restriction system protein
MKNIYVVRADFGRYTQNFKQHGYVGLGWFNQLIDKSFSREDIKELYRKKYPKDVPMRVNQNAGQVFRFVNDIQEGDIVITPYSDHQLLVGKVTSDVYHEDDNTSVYPLRRKVEWFDKTVNRQNLSIPLQNSLRSSLTFYTLNDGTEILEKYQLIPKNELRVTTEFNIYTTIKNKLLELDGFEFEIFVSYLLRTIGFEMTDEKQGGVGDGGIDFEGILSVYNIASINLQVQVKRYNKNKIKWQDVAAFRGAMKKDYQGCFISLSDFDKKAVENATDKSKIPITLINGKNLIDIFIGQYDEIIAAMREEENDDLADKLRFKKALVPL